MDKTAKFYLSSLPFFSLISIVLSTFRSTGQGGFNEIFLLALALLDLIVIYKGRKYLLNYAVLTIFLMSFFTFIIGLINFELSRRFITDFTNPVFFFAKIYIFKEYWSRNDLSSYLKYYTRFAFIGSIVLLPFVYFMFASTGSTRLAIFPPMELPFSNYLISGNNIFLLFSFVIIFLYGKRAILVGAFLTLLTYIIFVNRKNLLKYILFLVFFIVIMIQVFTIFSDNLAVKRITYTFELFSGKDDNKLNKISAGRSDEVDAIIKLMDPIDYVIGKGAGFKYYMMNKGELEEATNAHFSPLGFLSKYGIIFTLFIYVFLYRILFRQNIKHLDNKNFLIALCTSIFIFIESFFAYTTFVAPIYPVLLGAVLYYKSNKELPKKLETHEI